MKALTLTQPWASLVAIGAKRIETRSWRTAYRGRLAIHAAQGFPVWAQETCKEPGFALALAGEALPRGAVVATCTLVDCVPTEQFQPGAAGVAFIAPFFSKIPVSAADFAMTEQERLFGDYAPGRWAWLLSDIRKLDSPISAKGAQQLWNWEGQAGGAAVIRQISRQFEVESTPAIRIFLKRNKLVRTFILENKPYPAVGDFVKFAGEQYEVWKIEPADVILHVKAGGQR